MSVEFATIFTSESSGGPGTPTLTLRRMDAFPFELAPFASNVPIVRLFDDWTGGLHDGNTSGGPWVRLPVPVHSVNEGTSDATIGLAASGRGWVALATLASTIAPRAATASAKGSALLFLMVI